jgi:hypothetical protein
MSSGIQKNLESVDIQRYSDLAEHKHKPLTTLMVDVTALIPVFQAEVNLNHPELGVGEVFSIFKIGIEVHFIIYCMNEGFVDEHYMDIITEELQNLEVNISKEETELFPNTYAGTYDTAFQYIHDFIPNNVNKKNLLPIRWEVFGDRLKLVICEYPNLLETLFEEI